MTRGRGRERRAFSDFLTQPASFPGSGGDEDAPLVARAILPFMRLAKRGISDLDLILHELTQPGVSAEQGLEPTLAQPGASPHLLQQDDGLVLVAGQRLKHELPLGLDLLLRQLDAPLLETLAHHPVQHDFGQHPAAGGFDQRLE